MKSIYVDFHNSSEEGVRLNAIGTINDLNAQGVVLIDGLRVRLYCDQLEVIGTVRFSETEKIWIAQFNPGDLRPITG